VRRRPLPPVVIIGNPKGRRVAHFQKALSQRGHAEATVISYLQLLGDEASHDSLAFLRDETALLRIESPGEDADVERALLAFGYAAAVAAGFDHIEPDRVAALQRDYGRIICPRQTQLGFSALLERLERQLKSHRRCVLLNHPRAIDELFDKRRTSRRYKAAGIPVPEYIDGIEDVEMLRAAVVERDWVSVFVKLSCSSSGACLALFVPAKDGRREFVLTTIEMTSTGWYNTLRPRQLRERRQIDRLLEYLLREGAQIERDVPKARLGGAFFDCRVLCIDGQACFTVVRQNRHPITNLHLGGFRGDLDAMRARCPREIWQAALQSCEQVAALHGDSFHLGVDLVIEAGFRGHRIVEANAFGDLLPGLTRDGLDVYKWQIAALEDRFAAS
jgi:hypothetical protein